MNGTTQGVRPQIETIFQEVFNDPDLTLRPGMTADDVADWDSLAHVSLMFTIEQHFGIYFSDAEMSGLENVDELINAVEGHLLGR